MSVQREFVDWKMLKALGWPYSRQHTFRLIERRDFPQPYKFGKTDRARVFWKWAEVVEAIERYRPH